jgi:hypothetical protein
MNMFFLEQTFSPPTSDDFSYLPYVLLAGIALAAIVVLLILKNRKK